MRIISGKFKGKNIFFLKNSITRPLKDSVKENIFNILNHSKLINLKIDNKNILDLYSGIGSFGLECISRGAGSVTFVEKDKKALNILKKNLKELSVEEKSFIYENFQNFVLQNFQKKFDIFFFDPPFNDKTFYKNLGLIKNKKIFNKSHIIIIHREKKSEDNFDFYMNILLIKYYGRSKIIFGNFN